MQILQRDCAELVSETRVGAASPSGLLYKSVIHIFLGLYETRYQAGGFVKTTTDFLSKVRKLRTRVCQFVCRHYGIYFNPLYSFSIIQWRRSLLQYDYERSALYERIIHLSTMKLFGLFVQ